MDLRRRGVEAKLVVRSAQGKASTPDTKLIALITQAHHWFDLLTNGDAGSIRELARRECVDPSDIEHNMQFAYLAPETSGSSREFPTRHNREF